jgi:hypothetical protein
MPRSRRAGRNFAYHDLFDTRRMIAHLPARRRFMEVVSLQGQRPPRPLTHGPAEGESECAAFLTSVHAQ